MITKQLIDSIPELRGLGYEQISAWFNQAPLIDNPAPQAEVPVPFAVAELFGLLQSQQDIAVISESMNLIELGDRIAQKLGVPNPHTPQSMLSFFVQNGLSEGSKTAIEARLAETQPDPNHQSQIVGNPRWQTYQLTRPVKPEDVQEAFNAAAK